MNQINPRNKPQEDMKKFKSEIGNMGINALDEQEVDKAKAQLKVLKEYINNSYAEHRKRSGGGFSANKVDKEE